VIGSTIGEDIPFHNKFLDKTSRGCSMYLLPELEKDNPKIIFFALVIASQNLISDSALLLSGKITSNAIIAAHELFNLSITGIYAVLSNGNLHSFDTVFSSISTMTISFDALLV
jgi:hypothetical protein